MTDRSATKAACDEYDEAIDELRRQREQLDDATEEFREASARLETVKKSHAEADEAARRCAEENLDALLSRPTQWNGTFRRMEAFKRRHGHCNVRRNVICKEALAAMDPEEKKLGNFAGRQRADARRPPGHPDRIEWYKKIALDRLGFDWEPQDNKWMAKYEELKRYKRDHGNCRIKRYDPENFQLSEWVAKQRKNYLQKQNGKYSDMSSERIKLLNELDFDWTVHDRDKIKKSDDKIWEEYFDGLCTFKKIYGHTLVPPDYRDKGLSRWVPKQRRELKRFEAQEESELTADQVHRLEGLGFLYHNEDVQWMTWYQKLRAYSTLFGTTVVVDYNGEYAKLEEWVEKQRVALQKRRTDKAALPDDYTKLLRDIGLLPEINSHAREQARKKRPARHEGYPSISPTPAQKRQRVTHPAAADVCQNLPMPPYPYYSYPQAMMSNILPAIPWDFLRYNPHAPPSQASHLSLNAMAQTALVNQYGATAPTGPSETEASADGNRPPEAEAEAAVDVRQAMMKLATQSAPMVGKQSEQSAKPAKAVGKSPGAADTH